MTSRYTAYVALLALGGGLIALRQWWKRRSSDHVSTAWLVNDDRREWTAGVDNVAIKWPMNKILNEAGRFNRHRLRKRA